jgi:aminoglycoside phosphotransferase family enzyme/predicted kinase
VAPEAVAEWATLMRRLPASGMLPALLAAGAAPADLAARLAARLIPFHRDVAPRCAGEAAVVAGAATRIVTDNLAEIANCGGAALGTGQFGIVAEAMHRFIVTRGELLRERAAAGWVREGHGDLRAEHVCLEPDGALQIFDCVEFNRDVRCADVASDLAYLLMDLTRLGAPAAAVDLLARYRAAGIDLPNELMRFYAAHRALVRVKVACLEMTDAAAPRRRALQREAADYLGRATAAALTVRPALVVMTGLSGTGKSTVAAAVTRALGIRGVATDDVRAAQGGDADLARGEWQAGLYAPERTEAIYDELLARGADTLARGEGVLLDGTFLADRWRERAARLAADWRAPLALVETVCAEAVVRERLAARQASGGSRSDADYDIYRRQFAAATAEPPGIPAGAIHVRIDTSGDHAADLGPLFRELRRAGIVETVIPETAWPPGA